MSLLSTKNSFEDLFMYNSIISNIYRVNLQQNTKKQIFPLLVGLHPLCGCDQNVTCIIMLQIFDSKPLKESTSPWSFVQRRSYFL